MKVLYIERCLSGDSIVFDQIQRIADNGVDFHCYAIQVGGCPDFIHDNVSSVRCPFFPKIERIKCYLFLRATMKELNISTLPDSELLLHAHLAYPEGFAAYKISKAHNIPYIVTLRGGDIFVYPKKKKFLRKIVEKVLKNASGIIGVSQKIIEEAIDLGADRKTCFFQPDGIDESVFRCSNEEVREKCSVLFVGGLLPVKNIGRLLKAFAIICKDRDDIKLELVGSGPMEHELKGLAIELGIYGKCNFAGQLPPAKVAGKMQRSTTLALPSISEGWGNVITEAMACGTPVVGADVGGIPEQICNCSDGFLCDPYSPEDIAAKIISALDKKWDHKLIARHGTRYSRNDAAKNIVGFYRQTLDKYYSYQQLISRKDLA